MQAVLVDDHLLFAVLRDVEPIGLRSPDTTLWTTGIWHHRLCRGMFARGVSGVFSRLIGRLDDPAIARLVDLPQDIGSISFRHLAWPMARLLDEGVRLNLLSLEALAAAEELGATICLAPEDENPPLIAAAEARGVEVRIVPVG